MQTPNRSTMPMLLRMALRPCRKGWEGAIARRLEACAPDGRARVLELLRTIMIRCGCSVGDPVVPRNLQSPTYFSHSVLDRQPLLCNVGAVQHGQLRVPLHAVLYGSCCMHSSTQGCEGRPEAFAALLFNPFYLAPAPAACTAS